MEFNSYLYIFLFLPIGWALYQVFRTTAFANHLLTGLSVVFYCWVVWWFILPMAVSAVLDYFVGAKIAQTDEDQKRRRLLMISVVVNLGLLSFFKYTTWLSGELAALIAFMGLGTFPVVSVTLPPGISFYTFQTMSYTIDIYRKDFKPHKSFIEYLSFVSFFPQLVAGPIERAKDLLPQISKVRPPVPLQVACGALFMVLFGLFIKTVVADNMGGIIDMVFEMMGPAGDQALPAGMGILFAYAFAFQIYCDFAAYSHIARGTARLFGIELRRNFLTPYFSTSPSEFWERWHISLSSWLRDYLYIPLGGNRFGKLLTLRNLVLTMFLGGLWHGAGIFFIIWGLWHGALLVFYRLCPVDQFLINRFGRVGKILAMILMFHLVCFGWIFFRASPDQLMPILDSIVRFPGAVLDVGVAFWPYWIEVVEGRNDLVPVMTNTFLAMLTPNWSFHYFGLGVAIFSVPILIADYIGYRRNEEFPDVWERMPVAVKALSVVVLLYGIQFLGRRESNEFIYFQF